MVLASEATVFPALLKDECDFPGFVKDSHLFVALARESVGSTQVAVCMENIGHIDEVSKSGNVEDTHKRILQQGSAQLLDKVVR